MPKGTPGGDRVERLARTLLISTDEDAEAITDIETARRVAAARLGDSEARTFDPAVTDPGNSGVIRRTSEETTTDKEAEEQP
ncbi:MAG: hypothetical protein M3333_08545 [Actinomycetota bacterium]|nr:hypothetical protein [Actinomycetota bacterium]